MRKQAKKKKVINISWQAWDMAAERFMDKRTYLDIGELHGVSRQRAFQQVDRVRKAFANA